MSDDCPECTLARERVWHGVYLVDCYGCRARGIARSQHAARAVATRKASELAEVAEAAMPKLPLQEAMAMVWAWWRRDHPTPQHEQQSEGTAA